MNTRERETEEREKFRKDVTKKAVSLAMQSRWEDAVNANCAIIEAFPEEIEAYNRLGKALGELGRNREARDSFKKALDISPINSIAKKNLGRLAHLEEVTTPSDRKTGPAPKQFIEESGKAGVTSLNNIPSGESLLKLSPGDTVHIEITDSGLNAVEHSGQCVGRVEPRLASRLTRLIRGGNRYEAVVTSVDDCAISIIIREVYQDPSQRDIVSFPLKGSDYRLYVPSIRPEYELMDNEASSEDVRLGGIKDWSDDDTEPGDDEAFTPVLHRIINPNDDESDDQGDVEGI